MSEFSLGEASLGTSVDLSGLDKGIADAEEKGASGFAKIGDVMGSALKVGVAAAGVAVVAAIAGIGIAAFDTASQVNQASNDIQASLGVTAEQADELGQTALRVWGQNWGDSISDVKDSIITVRQQMKGLADEELEGVTAKALAIRDVFGTEVTESTGAANMLMEKFGLTSDEAFDFITKGMQSGLNASGDFLESVNEYSVQFKDAGFNAEQMFSLMQTGAQNGVLGTDKAADAIKEFRIKLLEMSDEVWGPDGAMRTSLGMTNEEIRLLSDGLQDGTLSAADAFETLMPKLAGIENEVHRNAIGVQLFGTQWEDLGPSAMMALDPTLTKLGDMTGATDSLNAKYDNWPAMWEGIKRSALVAIEPLGEKLLGIANDIMPVVTEGFNWFASVLPGIIDGAIALFDQVVAVFSGLAASWSTDSSGLGAAISTLWTDSLQPAFAEIQAWLGEVLPVAIQAAADFWTNVLQPALQTVAAFLADPVIPTIGLIVDWLREHIPAAIQTASDFWTGTLQPALQAVWEFINGSVIPIVQQLVGDTFTSLNTKTQEVSDFWTGTLQPALSAVWSFLNTYVIPLFTALANVAIALVKKEVELLAALWNNVLKPALSAVWSFIQANVVPILQTLANTALADVKAKAQQVSDFWNGTLKPAFAAIASVITATLQPALSGLETVTSNVATWLGNIGNAVSRVIDWLKRLADSIDKIEIPSWLKGESPPPLADWFGYIGDEVAKVADALPVLGTVIDAVGANMRSKVKKMTDEISDSIQKTTEELQKKAEQVADALTGAMIGGFGAEADIARLKARNLDAIDELGDASRDEAMRQLALAELMAEKFNDPEQAAAFFKERSRQILELAELQDELSAAESEADKVRLQKKIDLIQQAQGLEQAATSLQKPDTALGGVIEALEGFLMDESVRNNMGGILDDPSGTIRGLTDLLGQLRGANTPPQMDSLARSGGPLIGQLSVTQLPGENGEELANRVLRLIELRMGGRM